MTNTPRSRLSGGPRLRGTWHDIGAPNRDIVWRHLRALRHEPPGRATKGERQRVFGAALEQAQQLFAAAASVDYASRPILLFYGLSQAGRAIAAASTTADNNASRLVGHGIRVRDLADRGDLHTLVIEDHGNGSFTQLAPLLCSGSLSSGSTLGQLWATVPDLTRTPLRTGKTKYLPTLWLEHMSVDGGHEVSTFVHGLPWRFTEAYSEDEFTTFIERYPTLANNRGSAVPTQPALTDRERRSASVRRAWTLPHGVDPGDLETQLTQAYLGDDDRYVFPSIGGDGQTLHPLLAWWAILYSLSMLARYGPASWSKHLDLDSCADAVSLESLLDRALDTCPQLVLHTVRSVST